MSSNDELHLPKIDFSAGLNPLTTGDDKWVAVRALVVPAVEAYGCFEVVYDKVTPEMKDALFSEDIMKELFGLPLEKKVRNISDKPYHGYIGNIPGRAYESLNVDNATDRRGVDEFSALMLGDEGNPSLSNMIHEFSKHLSELEQMVRRMVLESLAVDDYFESCIDSTTYALRLSKYGGAQQTDHASSTTGMQRHRDATTLSIVCQHGVEGLEVQTKDGRWLTPSPNSLTVIIGEAFWAWTNGRIEPAWHRVLMTGCETRYSAIFSVRPRDGCMVRAPAELVDDEHPLQFRPYKYEDYVRFRFSEAGFKTKCALRAYCGVQGNKDELEHVS